MQYNLLHTCCRLILTLRCFFLSFFLVVCFLDTLMSTTPTSTQLLPPQYHYHHLHYYHHSHSSISQHNLRSPPITSINGPHPHTSNTAGGSSSSINPLGSKSTMGQGTHSTAADSPYGLGLGIADPYFNNHPSHRPRSHRIQRPCSYVHVPYNHNNAPFAFMRLGATPHPFFL